MMCRLTRRSFFSFSATSVGVREVANQTSAAIPNSPPRVINGVNWQRFSVNDGSESVLKKRWGLDGVSIYLTIGGIEPRENSMRLLQAFKQVLQT